jgi:hypothetical protein
MEARMSEDRPLNHQEFASAVEVLRGLISTDELNRLQPRGPATVYTSLVTIWMMTLQRLGGGKSLSAIVKDVIAHNQQLLPDLKRVREGTLSDSTAAYSKARDWVEVSTVEYFATQVSNSLISKSTKWFEGRYVFILDGTTITLPPTAELKAAFPPATNQHGESVWPVAMLLVAHELQSGCAMLPEIGAMYGPENTSEGELAREVAKRLPRGSVTLVDSGFGIFSVVYGIHCEGHLVLSRMTKTRFKALVRQATVFEKGDGQTTWELDWSPSAKELQTNPHLSADLSVHVYLHQVNVGTEILHLVSTFPISSEQAAEIYSYRYDVEHDIRDIKVTLKIENIRAQSPEMFRKELLTSLVAYNLVVQFRRQAARIAGLEPRRLSFTGVWNTFQSFLLNQPTVNSVEWLKRYERALEVASRDKLPNRPGRSYPRKAHPRRPKSTKFMKELAKKTPPDST